MPRNKNLHWLLLLILCCSAAPHAEARRHHHRRRHRYTGPPPTHPVVLWARTLEESSDKEQRKIAAFKLSQYSQTIYQEPVVNTLVRCMHDPDVLIKVLCTKALGRAGSLSQDSSIRKLLLEQYKTDPSLRNTIVRTFITRHDNSPIVHETFLQAAAKSQDQEEILVLMSYFEQFGDGSDRYVETLAGIYRKHDDLKLKRAVVKALGDRGQGQDTVVDILSQCSQSKDTPLALNCLAGLQLQAKKDARAWSAVEKTIESADPDVLMATLDVINALPESPNPKIAARLVPMIEELDDSELQEKAVLALGTCGDQSEEIVKVLVKTLEDKDGDEAVRIAAALVLGKQAAAFPAEPREALVRCSTQASAQGLRTACQLGQQELNARAKSLAAQPSPSVTPKPRAQALATPMPDGKGQAAMVHSSTIKARILPSPGPSPDPKLSAHASASPSPRGPDGIKSAARSQASTEAARTLGSAMVTPSPSASSGGGADPDVDTDADN